MAPVSQKYCQVVGVYVLQLFNRTPFFLRACFFQVFCFQKGGTPHVLDNYHALLLKKAHYQARQLTDERETRGTPRLDTKFFDESRDGSKRETQTLSTLQVSWRQKLPLMLERSLLLYRSMSSLFWLLLDRG